jgi:serine/threonine protein kinase
VTESFGKYQLEKKLATGGMAEVWLARQTGIEGFNRNIVVKRILPHLAEDPEFVNMFLQEARIERGRRPRSEEERRETRRASRRALRSPFCRSPI